MTKIDNIGATIKAPNARRIISTIAIYVVINRSKNIKILRIRSGELLPTEQELFEAIDYLVSTEHKFKAIILSDWKEEVDLCQKQSQVAM